MFYCTSLSFGTSLPPDVTYKCQSYIIAQLLCDCLSACDALLKNKDRRDSVIHTKKSSKSNQT